MDEPHSFELGLQQGLRMGRLEGFLFKGLPPVGPLPGARFTFRRSLFDAYTDYERAIIDNLRELQRLRWEEECGTVPDPPAPVHVPAIREPLLTELERTAQHDLQLVREAVDAELEEGRGRACVVAALRANPQMPDTVREYSATSFVSGDQRRVWRGDVAALEFAGIDYGERWGLESPLKRWRVTRWRIAWLCGPRWPYWYDKDAPLGEEDDATAEVCAAELAADRRPTGRVWLLGTIRTLSALEEALRELKYSAMGERNSLIAAADSVARVARDKGWA